MSDNLAHSVVVKSKFFAASFRCDLLHCRHVAIWRHPQLVQATGYMLDWPGQKQQDVTHSG